MYIYSSILVIIVSVESQILAVAAVAERRPSPFSLKKGTKKCQPATHKPYSVPSSSSTGRQTIFQAIHLNIGDIVDTYLQPNLRLANVNCS